MATWHAVANNDSIYVRVGTDGAIETNTDPDAFDNVWVARASGISDDLYGVAWNGFRFVAVGEGGVGLTSIDNGVTWTAVNPGVATDLYGLTAAGNVFLACGASGVLRVSQDGLAWEGIASGTTFDLWDITAADGEYIAVGDNDVIVTGAITSTLLDIFLSPRVGLNDELAVTGVLNIVVNDGFAFDSSLRDAAFAPDPILVAVTEHLGFEDQGETDVGGAVESGFDETSTDLDVVVTETLLLDEADQARYWGDLAETIFEQLNDELALSSVQSWDQWIMASTAADSLSIRDVPFINNETLADTFALSTSLAGAYGAVIVDGIGLDDALALTVRWPTTVTETLALEDVLALSGTLVVTVSDTVAFGDAFTPSQIINELIAEGLSFGVALTLDGETYLAWVMNTETLGLTNYENFRFNSMCGFGGAYYATDGTKIYRLGGDTDAGTAISAEFSPGATDFGSDLLKRMDRAYFGFRADGQMVLKVITDEKVEDWYQLEHVPDGIGESRVKIGKGLEARYWRFRIANKAGADFSFDSIRLLPLTARKRV